MASLLVTPKKRLSLLVFSILLVLAQPAFSATHYMWNLDRGAYPPEADSIAIPIFGEFLVWIIVAPFAIRFIVRTLKEYKDPISLFEKRSFSRQQLATNIVFGILVGYALLWLNEVVRYKNIPVLTNVTLWLYLFLCLRVVVIQNKLNQQTSAKRA